MQSDRASRDWPLIWLAVGFGLWAVVLLVHPILPKPDSSGQKLLDLIISASSAIGTAAAAIVALWLGVAARRRDQDKDRRLAHVTAARLARRVTLLLGGFRRTRWRLLLPEADVARVLQEMREEFPAESINYTDAELLGLTPLDDYTAQRLAHVSVALNGLFGDMEDWDEVAKLLGDDLSNEMLTDRQRTFHELHRMAIAIGRAFDKNLVIGIRGPTEQELVPVEEDGH